jgi:putative DNA primase/helicase
VRLFHPADGTLGLAEGIETAMAATLLTGIPCWATLGTERLARIALPATVGRVILFLDNDAPGRRAGRIAFKAFAAAGVAIEARLPAASGADWNDVLLDRGRGMS